ncbi:MAG TPA: histone deacetylase [Gemmatimonadaceae bacterium]|nr:histone deacetylase [Gemmatimonadaceae bacterium]
MPSLPLWSSSRYTVPLPAGHRFPIEKYALLREAVVADGFEIQEPPRARVEDLTLAHTPDYVARVTEGRLTSEELRRIGFPWSPHLVERSYRAVGGTVAATGAALESGIAMNLAGGTHHAFREYGEGFCVFNDVAVAILTMLRDGRVRRAAVIDLDVHQGNGTHAIFAGDQRVFTFSMHGRRNFPFNKVAGTLDVELEDGTADDSYLACLGDALPRVLDESRADIAVYLAGADTHENDRLGRLRLTFDGLARRDALVLSSCRDIGLPIAIVIAGGYGREIRDTVRIHRETVRIASTFA